MPTKRTFAVAAATIALAATGLLTGTASATTETSYPTTPVSLPHGASWFDGQITWYNRSVSVDGTLRGASGDDGWGCKSLLAQTFISSSTGTPLDTKSTSRVCDTARIEHLALDANVVGGAGRVVIHFRDNWGDDEMIANCTKASCTTRTV